MSDYGGNYSYGYESAMSYASNYAAQSAAKSAPTVSVSSASTGWGTLFSFLGAAAEVYGTAKALQIQKSTADQLTSASRQSVALDAQSRAEQQATNSAQAANERRQQLREERVKRGKLMQADVNTGTAYSSGEGGAAGALSTQLNSNLGSNLGALQSATNISNNSQMSADILGNANNIARANNVDANMWSGISGLGGSVFKASGGFNSLFSGMDWSQSPAPVVNKSTKLA